MIQRMFAIVAIAALSSSCDYRTPGVGIVAVTPVAVGLGFRVQPTNAQVGVAISPVVQVAVLGENGQPVSSATDSISISLVPGTGAPGAVLSGGGPQAASSGIVSFGNLRISLPGTGYQLLATAPGFPSVASTQFNITP
jgi:hypothetical protein